MQKKKPQKFPRIEGNKRIAFFGKTRTGKSTMARFLLEMKANEGWWIVIVDPKKGWMMRDEGRTVLPYGELGKWTNPITGHTYEDFTGSVEFPIWSNVFVGTARVIIYTPVSWDSFLDDMVRVAMEHKYVIFYFDEIRQLASAQRIPQMLVILYTQGAASLCGAWTGNQRPIGVPEDMKSQSEIWIVFLVPKYEDRIVISDYMTRNAYLDAFIQYELPYYYFLYYDDRMSGPVIMPPLALPGVKPEMGRGGQVVRFEGKSGERTG